MATAKTTATKKAAAKAAPANNNNAKLEQAVQALENRVADLEKQLATASASPGQAAGVTAEQVANTLRCMGAREWVLKKLKQ